MPELFMLEYNSDKSTKIYEAISASSCTEAVQKAESFIDENQINGSILYYPADPGETHEPLKVFPKKSKFQIALEEAKLDLEVFGAEYVIEEYYHDHFDVLVALGLKQWQPEPGDFTPAELREARLNTAKFFGEI